MSLPTPAKTPPPTFQRRGTRGLPSSSSSKKQNLLAWVDGDEYVRWQLLLQPHQQNVDMLFGDKKSLVARLRHHMASTKTLLEQLKKEAGTDGKRKHEKDGNEEEGEVDDDGDDDEDRLIQEAAAALGDEDEAGTTEQKVEKDKATAATDDKKLPSTSTVSSSSLLLALTDTVEGRRFVEATCQLLEVNQPTVAALTTAVAAQAPRVLWERLGSRLLVERVVLEYQRQFLAQVRWIKECLRRGDDVVVVVDQEKSSNSNATAKILDGLSNSLLFEWLVTLASGRTAAMSSKAWIQRLERARELPPMTFSQQDDSAGLRFRNDSDESASSFGQRIAQSFDRFQHELQLEALDTLIVLLYQRYTPTQEHLRLLIVALLSPSPTSKRVAMMSALVIVEALGLWKVVSSHETAMTTESLLPQANDTPSPTEALVSLVQDKCLAPSPKRPRRLTHQDETFSPPPPESLVLLALGLLLRLESHKQDASAGQECMTQADEQGAYDFLELVLQELVTSKTTKVPVPVDVPSDQEVRLCLLTSHQQPKTVEYSMATNPHRDPASILMYASIAREIIAATVASFLPKIFGGEALDRLCHWLATIHDTSQDLREEFWREWDDYCRNRSSHPLCTLLDTSYRLVMKYNAKVPDADDDYDVTDATFLPAVSPLLRLVSSLAGSSSDDKDHVVVTTMIPPGAIRKALRAIASITSSADPPPTESLSAARGVLESCQRLATAPLTQEAFRQALEQERDENDIMVIKDHAPSQVLATGPKLVWLIAVGSWNASRHGRLPDTSSCLLRDMVVAALSTLGLLVASCKDGSWVCQLGRCLQEGQQHRLAEPTQPLGSGNLGLERFLHKATQEDTLVPTVPLAACQVLSGLVTGLETVADHPKNDVVEYVNTVGSALLLACDALSQDVHLRNLLLLDDEGDSVRRTDGKNRVVQRLSTLGLLLGALQRGLLTLGRVRTLHVSPPIRDAARNVRDALVHKLSSSSALLGNVIASYAALPVTVGLVDGAADWERQQVWGSSKDDDGGDDDDEDDEERGQTKYGPWWKLYRVSRSSTSKAPAKRSRESYLLNTLQNVDKISLPGTVEDVSTARHYPHEQLMYHVAYGALSVLTAWSQAAERVVSDVAADEEERIKNLYSLGPTSLLFSLAYAPTLNERASAAGVVWSSTGSAARVTTTYINLLSRYTCGIGAPRQEPEHQQRNMLSVAAAELLTSCWNHSPPSNEFLEGALSGGGRVLQRALSKCLEACIDDANKTTSSGKDVRLAVRLLGLLSQLVAAKAGEKLSRVILEGDVVTHLETILVTMMTSETTMDPLVLACLDVVHALWKTRRHRVSIEKKTEESDEEDTVDKATRRLALGDAGLISHFVQRLVLQSNEDGILRFLRSSRLLDILTLEMTVTKGSHEENDAGLLDLVTSKASWDVAAMDTAIRFTKQWVEVNRPSSWEFSWWDCRMNADDMGGILLGDETVVRGFQSSHLSLSFQGLWVASLARFHQVLPSFLARKERTSGDGNGARVESAVASLRSVMESILEAQFQSSIPLSHLSAVALAVTHGNAFCHSLDRWFTALQQLWHTKTKLPSGGNGEVFLATVRNVDGSLALLHPVASAKDCVRLRCPGSLSSVDAMEWLNKYHANGCRLRQKLLAIGLLLMTLKDEERPRGMDHLQSCVLELACSTLMHCGKPLEERAYYTYGFGKDDKNKDGLAVLRLSLAVLNACIRGGATAEGAVPAAGRGYAGALLNVYKKFHVVASLVRIFKDACHVEEEGGDKGAMEIAQSVMELTARMVSVAGFDTLLLREPAFSSAILDNQLLRSATEAWSKKASKPDAGEKNKDTSSATSAAVSSKRGYRSVQQASGDVVVKDPVHELWGNVVRLVALLLRSFRSHKADDDVVNICEHFVSKFLRNFGKAVSSGLESWYAKEQQPNASTNMALTKNLLQEASDSLLLVRELCTSNYQQKLLMDDVPEICEHFVEVSRDIIQPLALFVGALGNARELCSALTDMDSNDDMREGRSFGETTAAFSAMLDLHPQLAAGIPNARHEAMRNAHFVRSAVLCETTEEFTASLDAKNGDDGGKTIEQSLNNSLVRSLEGLAGRCLFYSVSIVAMKQSASSFVSFVAEEAEQIDARRFLKTGRTVAIRQLEPKEGVTGGVAFAKVIKFHPLSGALDADYFGDPRVEHGIPISRVTAIEDSTSRRMSLAMEVAPKPHDAPLPSKSGLSTGHFLLILRWCKQRMEDRGKTDEKHPLGAPHDLVRAIATLSTRVLVTELCSCKDKKEGSGAPEMMIYMDLLELVELDDDTLVKKKKKLDDFILDSEMRKAVRDLLRRELEGAASEREERRRSWEADGAAMMSATVFGGGLDGARGDRRSSSSVRSPFRSGFSFGI